LIINTVYGREICILVGQDGWHYSNLWLSSHVLQKENRLVPLRQLKGAPETFDVDGLLAWLRQIKIQDESSFPIYSREQHDPLPDAGRIKLGHRIILLEGNYLLLDRPGWREIQALSDRSIFLSAPMDTLLAGLRERHLRGGKDPQSVENHLHAVDQPDINLVMEFSKSADILVEKTDLLRIERIIYP
jgi:hypothetical protein